MEKIEIIIHNEHHHDGFTLNLDPGLTIQEAICVIAPEEGEELLIILEGMDHHCERHHRLHDCGIQDGHHLHVRRKIIHYTVDKENQETTAHRMTPEQIMTNAGLDPKTHYLVRLRGEGCPQESYKDRPGVPIHMHEGMEFITGSLGPTPVS